MPARPVLRTANDPVAEAPGSRPRSEALGHSRPSALCGDSHLDRHLSVPRPARLDGCKHCLHQYLRNREGSALAVFTRISLGRVASQPFTPWSAYRRRRPSLRLPAAPTSRAAIASQAENGPTSSPSPCQTEAGQSPSAPSHPSANYDQPFAATFAMAGRDGLSGIRTCLRASVGSTKQVRINRLRCAQPICAITAKFSGGATSPATV